MKKARQTGNAELKIKFSLGLFEGEKGRGRLGMQGKIIKFPLGLFKGEKGRGGRGMQRKIIEFRLGLREEKKSCQARPQIAKRHHPQSRR